MAEYMKLITELNESVTTLCEAKEDGKKQWFIEGTWMQSNIVNRNNRRYPKDILESRVNTYIQKYVNDNRAVGELGHPDGPTINQERISHKILELKQVGDDWVGKAKVVDFGLGITLQGILSEGIKVGVSSRGMGSLKEGRDGIMEVQDDFFLATAGDVVHDPSAPSAFVNGIMEGVNYFWDGGLIKIVRAEEIAEKARLEIEEAARSRELTAKKQGQIFENYLRSLFP
jgi:hypothetical protein